MSRCKTDIVDDNACLLLVRMSDTAYMGIRQGKLYYTCCSSNHQKEKKHGKGLSCKTALQA